MDPQNFGCKKFWVRNFLVQTKFCSKIIFDPRPAKNWVQKAEIFLIWINVARTNVAWTNVHLTVVLDCME